jgi:hypothetical protein
MLQRTTVLMGVLAVVIVSPALSLGIENYPADGVAGIIGPLIAPEDTAYARSYTLAGWRRVSVGMSRIEVDAILGPPQRTYSVDSTPNGGDTGARWSYSPGDTNFRCRVLIFHKGVVIEKHSEYYFD